MTARDPKVEDALHRASDENGLDPVYRDCVRPLLRDPDGRWPECCGGTCEPCSQVLTRVASRTLDLLGTPRKA